jgi:hypothetical protein
VYDTRANLNVAIGSTEALVLMIPQENA